MEDRLLPAGFRLTGSTGILRNQGVDVTAFEDFYPAGHQSGVSVLMHGERVAANGDVRFEPTPGQWQAVPVQVSRIVEENGGQVVTRLHYPDEKNHLKGFNPTAFPDCELDYTVTVRADGESVLVTVDPDGPVDPRWRARLRFNLELFPGLLFGKPWIMDGACGIFPRQPSGSAERTPSLFRDGIWKHPDVPEETVRRMTEADALYSPLRADEDNGPAYASGRRFVMCPGDPLREMAVETLGENLELYDGRFTHNNGWFVLSSAFSANAPHAVQWRLTPRAAEGWTEQPKLQVSQVGYLPAQPKTAVAELDRRDGADGLFTLRRITAAGEETVRQGAGEAWGLFLRYRYLRFDFSDVTEPGLYRVDYAGVSSSVFRIGPDVLDHGVWQPVLEYFLPIQMCHMTVREKYRVWHGLCHRDDARMAPVNWNHFDGYRQGPETLTRFRPGDCVPGLDRGGWHDAGDFDLRIESQSGEAYQLALTYETFGVEWDSTTIDQETRSVEIHRPDGKNDLLQQAEHGALAVLGGWKALGRLYRGVIASGLRQYVLLGDPAVMTEGVPGDEDDRWVFTEDNPLRELTVAAHLAAVFRALKDFSPDVARDCLEAAKALYAGAPAGGDESLRAARVHAAAELFLAVREPQYRTAVLEESALVAAMPRRLGWIAARAADALDSPEFTRMLRDSLAAWKKEVDALSLETPYGVPYRPHIWGAGWEIQRMACEHYFLVRAFPDLFTPDLTCRALDFILGCHPGQSVSFASGVGARSVTTAYGFNRADSSCIPGGVVSGTALIRPDFPELKDWPYFWQQTEYVLGGGSTRFLFLVHAVRELCRPEAPR